MSASQRARTQPSMMTLLPPAKSVCLCLFSQLRREAGVRPATARDILSSAPHATSGKRARYSAPTCLAAFGSANSALTTCLRRSASDIWRVGESTVAAAKRPKVYSHEAARDKMKLRRVTVNLLRPVCHHRSLPDCTGSVGFAGGPWRVRGSVGLCARHACEPPCDGRSPVAL